MENTKIQKPAENSAYSKAVHGKTFAAILSFSAFFMAFISYPELSQSLTQANLLQEIEPIVLLENTTFLEPVLRFIIFLLSTVGISLLLMTLLLKMEAKTNKKDESGKIWERISQIPSIAIVEALTFLWVVGSLALSVVLLVDLFQGQDLLSQINSITPVELLSISLICGLLGGSLASIKFFIPSGRDAGEDIKLFHIGYVYKYLSNPFFSSVIAFLSYLAFMNLQWFGLDLSAEDSAINILSLVFIFTMVGYFSENFISLMYAFVKKFTEWLESSFSLELQKHSSKPQA